MKKFGEITLKIVETIFALPFCLLLFVGMFAVILFAAACTGILYFVYIIGMAFAYAFVTPIGAIWEKDHE